MTVDPNRRGPHNTPCQHCGLLHGALCPSVKAYEYHPDGSLKRVEFRDAPPVWNGSTAPGDVTFVRADAPYRHTDFRGGFVNLVTE